MDESHFNPDYDNEVLEVTDDHSCDDIEQSDENNNAQRIKSVIVSTSTQKKAKTSNQVRQKIIVDGESEVEEGEISMSDNPENVSSFFENPDDQQLEEFLKCHQERIKRITKNPEQNKSKSDAGKAPDHLTDNIRKMSLRDKQSDQPVHNSQSEDTIYSRLVRERERFEANENGQDNHDKHDKQSLEQPSESSRVNTSNDSSLEVTDSNDTSNKEESNSTDVTDKAVIMDKFVSQETHNGELNNESNVSVSEVDSSPPPKRNRTDRPKKKITVKEYNKRKQRETKREEERRRQIKQQRKRERETENKRARAKDKRRRMEEEDKNPKAGVSDPPGESLSFSELELFISKDSGNNKRRASNTPSKKLDKRRRISKSRQIDEQESESDNSEQSSDDSLSLSSDSDDDYHLFAHMEQGLVEKIQQGKFVELPRLLPTGNLDFEDDDEGFATITKQGRLYLNKTAPLRQEKDLPSLNSFSKWQVAFRIFAAIYEKQFPDKGVELRQYERSIQKAASKFYWENVIIYDKLFRKRIAKYHLRAGYPKKSWAVKYHTAWDFELMDKLSTQDQSASGFVLPNNCNNNTNKSNASPNGFRARKYCGYFNKTGKCKYGNKCKFDHRCFYCNKRGHGIANCRAIKEKTNNSTSLNSPQTD